MTAAFTSFPDREVSRTKFAPPRSSALAIPSSVATNGTFGQRVRDQAISYGANVVEVKADEGKPVTDTMIERAITSNPGVRLIMVVHLETSTGVLNPIEEIGAVAKRHGIPSPSTRCPHSEPRGSTWRGGISPFAQRQRKKASSHRRDRNRRRQQSGMGRAYPKKGHGNGLVSQSSPWKKVQEGKEIRKGVVYPLPGDYARRIMSCAS